MPESKIVDIVSSLLSGVRGISKSETIIGEPQKAGDATVIPVHRVKIAFGAAGYPVPETRMRVHQTV